MKRRPSVLQVVSATVMLAGLIAALVLCQRLISRERTELESTAANDVRQIAARLQSGILESIGPLDRLGRWWISQGRPADLDDWNTDGKLFLSNSPGIRTAYWIGTDGYLRWQATPGAPPRLRRSRPDTNLAQL